jgi:hypothetical protein
LIGSQNTGGNYSARPDASQKTPASKSGIKERANVIARSKT